MTTLKLFGLPRTCTNIAAWLVEANFADVRVLHSEERWKHTLTPGPTRAADGYLLCTKNPHAWLASMRRYRPGPTSILLWQWNREVGMLRRMVEQGSSVVVRHEDIVSDYRHVLEGIGRTFDLARCGPWLNCDLTMARGGDGAKLVTDSPFDARYYTERRYLQDLRLSDFGAVAQEIDRDLMEWLGYEVTE